MRLLQISDSGNLNLTEPMDDVPPYAILSHTWGEDDTELKLQDVWNETYKSKKGYGKVRFCGLQAKKDGLDYFWVDTCCINKTDSFELAHAINSMFRWYQRAAKCYVYLADVPANKRVYSGHSEANWEIAYQESRWFHRGWTLQELLAPSIVEFFSMEYTFLGSKTDLAGLIYEITSIPVEALRGTPLRKFSVATRLSWASGRQTKKPEDRAYCLLGVFDVFLPPIYGEGLNAQKRLEEEISKKDCMWMDRPKTWHQTLIPPTWILRSLNAVPI